MNAGDTWKDEGTGSEYRVVAAYWKAGKREEDEARLRSRFDGELRLTQDESYEGTSVPEYQHRYYLSVPAGDFSRASNALYGI